MRFAVALGSGTAGALPLLRAGGQRYQHRRAEDGHGR